MKKRNDSLPFFPKKKGTVLAASIAAILGAGFAISQANAQNATGVTFSSMKTAVSNQQVDGAGTPVKVWLVDANGNPATNAVTGMVTLKDATGTVTTTVPYPAGQPYITIELGGANGVDLSGTSAGTTLQMVAEYANGVSSISNSSSVPVSVLGDFLKASLVPGAFPRDASTTEFDGFAVSTQNGADLSSATIKAAHMVNGSENNSSSSTLNTDGTLPVIFQIATGNITTANDEFYLISDVGGMYGQAMVPNQGNDTIPDITGVSIGASKHVNLTSGAMSDINATMQGGTSVGGDAPQRERTMSESSTAAISATYKIAQEHVGQPGDLLLVVGYVDMYGAWTPPGTVLAFYKTSTGWSGVDPYDPNALNMLGSYGRRESLAETEAYDVYSGAFAGMRGLIMVWPAYRLDDNSIVYPKAPISVTVNPAQ